MTNSTTPRIDRLQARSSIRQTVLNGPRTNNLADFLEIGTGLEVVSKNVGEDNPLTVTMGLGFDSRGFQLDETQIIETPFAISSLPDNEAKIYLYAQFDANNAISYGHTLLEPIYTDDEPSAPATGQYWYPRQHNSVGKVYNGASFDDVKRVFLGECTTSAGVVTEVISEGFQVNLRIPFGVEFFTGEYVNGEKVYQKCFSESFSSSSTLTLISSFLDTSYTVREISGSTVRSDGLVGGQSFVSDTGIYILGGDLRLAINAGTWVQANGCVKYTK